MTTWCLGEKNTPSWQPLELEEKFFGNAMTGNESKGPGVAAARAAVRDGEDQVLILVIVLDPELGNVPVAPPISGASEGSVPLAVGECNAQGHTIDICSWSILLSSWALRAHGQNTDEAVDAVIDTIWGDSITMEWSHREHPFLTRELILTIYKTPGGERFTRGLCGYASTYSLEGEMKVQGQ